MFCTHSGVFSSSAPHTNHFLFLIFLQWCHGLLLNPSLCVCFITGWVWYTALLTKRLSIPFIGMAKLCRQRPSWTRPQISVKVCKVLFLLYHSSKVCLQLDRCPESFLRSVVLANRAKSGSSRAGCCYFKPQPAFVCVSLLVMLSGKKCPTFPLPVEWHGWSWFSSSGLPFSWQRGTYWFSAVVTRLGDCFVSHP